MGGFIEHPEKPLKSIQILTLNRGFYTNCIMCKAEERKRAQKLKN